MLISIKNLSIFVNSSPILKNFSFEINQGDFVVISGENGCGKSTLMKTILGMRGEYEGTIQYGEGFSLENCGYIPQQAMGMIQKDFPATVREIVLSGCLNKMKWRPFYGKKEKELACENMEKLGILKLADKSFKNLSGGQQQRVLLARSLCAADKILFLDEPFSALDPKVTQEMYQLIEELNKKHGLTIVMISHDKENAAKYATKHIDFNDSEMGVCYE